MNSIPEPLLVLREQLPLPHPFAAPGTGSEIVLEKIWRTALSMDRVGVMDNYQDLGGDSFLATVIFAMIEEAFGLNVPMAILLESPTIRELGRKIDQLKQGA